MIVIASSNGNVGIDDAMQVLKNGGSALDAIEAGIRPVEANPEDHSVGYNSWPNILGELELDASIMDGRDLRSGAVAAMKGFPYAISVARQVMDYLPHVLLAGGGAERFAKEMKAEQWDELLTPEVVEVWKKVLAENLPADVLENFGPDTELREWVKLATDPERTYGTVNFIAIDKNGDMCTGVSTSGWSWKYPGRVGDSPIIGAGNYADNRYGGAACTGTGEMAIRACTAHSMVTYMKMGMSVEAAGIEAMKDLLHLGGDYIGGMNLVALDKDGNHAAMTSMTGKTYIYQTADMDAYVEKPRTYVEIPTRWAGLNS
jgi:beta-aspartyl-peptidase (threonine type)